MSTSLKPADIEEPLASGHAADSEQSASSVSGRAVNSEQEALAEKVNHENACPMCSSRHKSRTPEEQKALMTRLKRVEGQIRGIERMVEEGAYCPDILVQVSAATSALNSFNKLLLNCHIHSCVAEDIRAGKDDAIDELCQILQKLMK